MGSIIRVAGKLFTPHLRIVNNLSIQQFEFGTFKGCHYPLGACTPILVLVSTLFQEGVHLVSDIDLLQTEDIGTLPLKDSFLT